MADLIKSLEKEFGNGVLIEGKLIAERKRQVISVSPAIDVGIGGGIPEGSWVTLSGPPKYGKTTLALQIARNFLKTKQEALVFFMNVEGRLKRRDLNSMPGLDLNRIHVIQSTEEKILSAEDFLNIGEKVLMFYSNCMLIIDSFSALCNPKNIEEGVGKSTRGGNAATLAQFCSAMGNVVPVKNHIVVGITHIMANTSGYGANVMEKGGYAIQYQVDVKLRAKKRDYLTSGDKTIGQQVTWMVDNAALNATPNQEVISFIRYGYGIDEEYELTDMAVQLGLLEKTGNWIATNFEDLPVIKTNGKDNFVNAIREKPEYAERLRKIIYEALLS